MKKLFTTIFLITLGCIPLNTSASSCPIKGGPPQVLLDYIENNKIVIDNINAAEDNSPGGKIASAKYYVENILNTSEGVLNNSFSFRGYYSYVKFYAIFPIINEIPEEIKRDYKLLNAEIDSQMEVLKKLTQDGKGSFIVKDACKGVNGYCGFNENQTAIGALGALMRNTNDVLDLYRWTVINEGHNAKEGKLHLVSNNFKLEIAKNYSPESFNECDKEDGYDSRIEEIIEKILGLVDAAEDGIKEWQEAWALLFDSEPSKEADEEKKILKEYLDGYKIITDEEEIRENILKKYGLTFINENNSFGASIYKIIEANIAKRLVDFKEENFWDGIEKEEVITGEIKLYSATAKKSIEIQSKIARLYEEEIPFAALSDIHAEITRAKIIEAHSSMDVAIRILNRAIPVSRRICNSQGGGGICK